jgi:hypothetical protein
MTWIKPFSKSLFLFIVISLMIGCDEDTPDERGTITETPLTSFLADKDFEWTVLNDGEIYSLGYEFSPKRGGQVSAVGIASPIEGTFNVHLYEVLSDESTGAFVTGATITIASSETGKFKFVDLPIYAVIGNLRRFRITYSTNTDQKSFYRLHDQEGFNLPISTENITIERGVYGLPNQFPTQVWSSDALYLVDIRITSLKEK